MGTLEDIEQLKYEMNTCKIGVYKDIQDLKDGHRDLHLSLREQALERKEFNEKINKKLDDMSLSLINHTSDEMDTIKHILLTLQKLVADTDSNSSFIEKAKKYWVRTSFTVTGILGTIGSLYWLYSFLENHGIVFVLQTTAGVK